MKRNISWITALTVVIAALVIMGPVQAQEPTPAGESVVVESAVVDSAVVDSAVVDSAAMPAEPAQAVEVAGADCCAPEYCISYRKHHVRRKVCCGCCVEPYTAMLSITDPCTCCPVEVPVCVPGCCTDAPKVECRRGLLGRTIAEYTWCCGYRVRIVLDRRNNITVHTYGS